MSDTSTPSNSLPTPTRAHSRLWRVLRILFKLLLPGSRKQLVAGQNPRRGFRRIAVGFVVLLVLTLWFTPTIIAKSALRNRIARSAAADLNGTLDIGNASLGWFSTVELDDITLTDSQGRVVARVPKVTTSRTLLSLARDQSDIGEIVIERPSIDIVCEKNSTNLEAVLQKLLADSGAPPAATRTPIALKVIDGTLTLRDADTSRFSEFHNLDVAVKIPASRSEPLTVKLTANAPNHLEADASLGDTSRVKFAANGFPLESLAPLLRRVEPGLSVNGALTTDITATWGKDTVSVEGSIGLRQLAVTAPELKGDTLRVASAELPLRVTLTGRTVNVERAELTSDVGTASIAGTFDPESFDKLLDRPDIKLNASVDVAKLAAVLPRLLQIREGTEIREGKLTVRAESKAGPDGTAWSGSLVTSALKATRDNKDLHWEEPLSFEFVGRVKTGQLPTFEKLICKSDFIAVNAQVMSNSIRAAANVYLDRLAARLSEFVDLGDVALDGQASATLVAVRKPTGEFRVDAAVEAKQFACLDRKGKGIREAAVKLTLAATGKAPDGGHMTISTGSLTGTIGTDDVHLDLLEPIADAKQLSSGKFEAKLGGELSRWRKRIAVAVPVLDEFQLGGNATAHGHVRFAPDGFHIDRLTLGIENTKFVGYGLDIDEKKMDGVADLTVNTTTGITTFANFTIASPPLSVASGKLVIESGKDKPTVVYGGGPATTNLNRLGKSVGIFTDPQGPSALWGKGTGPIEFRYSGDVTTFNGTLDIVNFVVGIRNDPTVFEPTLRLELDGSYTGGAADTLSFKAAKIERPGLALAASGSLAHFDAATDTNVTGTLTYDMVKLTPKLRELLGPNLTAEGKGTKPVSFVGQLTPPPKPGSKVPPSPFATAQGEFGIGWASVNTHGFAMGPGALEAKLANGVAQISPISGMFGGGKISVHPTVRLAPAPSELTLARGIVVDNAKLTPAVCAGALGYALPAIANSTKAEGDISVTLDENHIPLADTKHATVKGTVVIHKATVSAGPVITEIATLLGANGATMTLANEQSVPVRIERGRVYHENLDIKLGGYHVKTRGSVGFDNTIDLMADVPIPGGLPGFKNTPALAKALTGKRVLVPIKGTLEKPSLDQKQFQLAVAKLAQDVAKEVGTNALHKELDKLLQGMPAPATGGGFFPFPKK